MSVRKGQARLRKIAKQLESNSPISNDDRLFLSQALKAISDGADAKTALNVRATRGERSGRHTRQTDIVLQIFLPNIGAAISSENRGRKLSVIEACRNVSEKTFPMIGLSPSTINRYWNRRKHLYWDEKTQTYTRSFVVRNWD